jgi:hypothetical protein
MRIAIVSDIHGNLTALEAVVADQPLVSATPMAPREARVLRALQGQVRMHPCV